MLQQILRDMWVDPEILAELDDTQKQTLFCKMREEQVRRWQVWDQKVGQESERPKVKAIKKQVQFLKGEDGEPWVWVMGEHQNDKSIDSMLEEEARARAMAQARHEAHQLRKSVEKELTQLIDYKPMDSLEQEFQLSPKSVELEDTFEMYCSVDELRQQMEALEHEVTDKPSTPDAYDNKYSDSLADIDCCGDKLNMDLNKNITFNFIEGKRDVLQELGVCGSGDGVSGLVVAWERRVAAARAGELLRGLRACRRRRDLRLQHHDHAAWKEQERKAKEAELAMREIARAAREAHRRSADIVSQPAPAVPLEAGKPPSREAVVEWFNTQELPRGAGREDNKPASWFHGVITRAEAEQALGPCSAGSFLVRVSERVWGYALSCRVAGGGAGAGAGSSGAGGGGGGGGGVRHYLVCAAPHYALHAAPAKTHRTLADLINYHRKVPITENGGELLKTPCSPKQTPAILSPPS